MFQLTLTESRKRMIERMKANRDQIAARVLQGKATETDLKVLEVQDSALRVLRKMPPTVLRSEDPRALRAKARLCGEPLENVVPLPQEGTERPAAQRAG